MDEITFSVKDAFQIANRHFYISGEILSGRIFMGMLVDLRPVGIEKMTEIIGIDFALHRSNGLATEDVALGLAGLSDLEKELLKKAAPFNISILAK